MNKHRLRSNAKDLRHNQTEAEKRIWSHIRNRQLGHKFQRQKIIDTYIVDFICIERRVIIEIDGGQHNQEADEIRSAYLENEGFTILRFWNNEIFDNMDGVIQKIQNSLL